MADEFFNKYAAEFRHSNNTEAATSIQDVLVNIALGNVPSHHGVKCYFMLNCLPDDSCLKGTVGPMCERCVRPSEATTAGYPNAYYLFGRLCLECPVVPFPCFFSLIPLLLFILGFCVTGFTVSLCTKTKMLFYYLQLLILTSPIQVNWPPLLLKVLSTLSFAQLNSRMFMIECYQDSFNWYYCAWAVTLVIPFVISIILKMFIRVDVDKPEGKSITNIRTNLIRKMIRRRTTATTRTEALTEQGMRDLKIRRFVFMILMLYYAPNCTNCLQTFSCSGSFPFVNMTLNATADVFFLDNRKSCIDLDFQAFNAIYLIVGFVQLLTPILWIFIVRRHYKWNELNIRIRTFGPLYESYKDTACHWDGVFMCRVLLATIVTELFPFQPVIQASVMFATTLCYTIFLFMHMPYRRCCWTCLTRVNLHNAFEVFATISVLSLHFHAVLLSVGTTIDWFEWYVIGTILFTVSYWTIIAVRIKSEDTMPEENIPEYFKGGQIQACCCFPCKKARIVPESSALALGTTREMEDRWKYTSLSPTHHRNENASPSSKHDQSCDDVVAFTHERNENSSASIRPNNATSSAVAEGFNDWGQTSPRVTFNEDVELITFSKSQK